MSAFPDIPKGHWPKVDCCTISNITIRHSLPADIGVETEHAHALEVRAGYVHEITPYMGCTKSALDMRKELDELLSMLDGKYINDILPLPPTAEVIACWLMARLPAYFSYVEIKTDYAFKVRVTADSMRSQWAEFFR